MVSFDNIADTRFVVPSLSSVHQPLDQLGARAFELVQEMLAGSSEAGPEPVHVPTSFIRRDSCGCPSSGLELSEQQARHQFHDNAYLQMTLNTQYELAVELLRTHEQDPRRMAWLGRTPALGGCLGLWTESARGEGSGEVVPVVNTQFSTAAPSDYRDQSLELVGAFWGGAGSAGGVGEADEKDATGGTLDEQERGFTFGDVISVSQFPPARLFDLADGALGDVVFVVPVRTQAHDWGVMSAVGRIQDTTPPGREMMNHSGALLGVALDHDAMLRSLREQEERLRRAALFDQLTGLPNRALLFDRLNQAGLRSLRYPEHQFALLFLDLDGFKAVNDTLGHAAGDQLLVHVAERLKDAIRESDTAARLGGDEFVVLLDDIAAPNDPPRVIERIQRVFGEPVLIDGHPVIVGASIGQALSADGFADVEDLLKDADEAMYAAKNGTPRPSRPEPLRLGTYFGAILIAPSSRMTSPFSIGFATTCATSAPYSAGFPSRDGCGTCSPSDTFASSGRPARSGVSNRPGAIVITRICRPARSRAIGRVIPTMPPLDAEYAA